MRGSCLCNWSIKTYLVNCCLSINILIFKKYLADAVWTGDGLVYLLESEIVEKLFSVGQNLVWT